MTDQYWFSLDLSGLLGFHADLGSSAPSWTPLSLAKRSSACLDSSQGAQHGTGSDPHREDHVDDFQSQQAPNLAFLSSGGVGRKGELQLDAISPGNPIPGQTDTAGRRIVPGWEQPLLDWKPPSGWGSADSYGLFGSNRLILLPCKWLVSPTLYKLKINLRWTVSRKAAEYKLSCCFLTATCALGAIFRRKSLLLNSNKGSLIQRAFETRDTEQKWSVCFDRR